MNSDNHPGTELKEISEISLDSSAEIICRTCHEAITPEQLKEQKDVFRPCHCRQPIHRICLQTWLEKHPPDNDIGSCEVCKYQYQYQPTSYHCRSPKELFCHPLIPTAIFSLLTLFLPLIWQFKLSFIFYIIHAKLGGALFLILAMFYAMTYLCGLGMIPIYYYSLFCSKDFGVEWLDKSSTTQSYLLAFGILALEMLMHLIGWPLVKHMVATGVLVDDPIFEGLSNLTFIMGLLVVSALAAVGSMIYRFYRQLRRVLRIPINNNNINLNNEEINGENHENTENTSTHRWATRREFFSHNWTIFAIRTLVWSLIPVLWRVDLVFTGNIIASNWITAITIISVLIIGLWSVSLMLCVFILQGKALFDKSALTPVQVKRKYMVTGLECLLGLMCHMIGVLIINLAMIPYGVLLDTVAIRSLSLLSFTIGSVCVIVAAIGIGIVAGIFYALYAIPYGCYKCCCRIPDGEMQIVPIQDGNNLV